MYGRDFDIVGLTDRVDALVANIVAAQDQADVAQHLKQFHLWTEEQLRTILNSEKDTSIDCRAGCGHCCVLTVRVLPIEATAIENHLRNSLPPGEFTAIIDQAKDLERDMNFLDDTERQLLRRPCPFLDSQQHCRIHAVRPLLCRSVTSIRSEDCLDAIAALSFGETVPVVMHLGQKDFFDSAFVQLSTALTEAELSGESSSLTAAVASFST